MAPASIVDLFGDSPEQTANIVYRRNSIGAQDRAPTYHQDEKAQYVLPNDFQEHVRLEIQALHLSNMMDGHVLHAPIKPAQGQRMLDIGCGTGIITDLISEKFPKAECIGLDLSQVPSIRAHRPNVRFFQGNASAQAASDWTPIDDVDDDNDGSALPQDTELFDYIFSRLLICGMTSWPTFIAKEFSLLKPGGWVEIHDLAWDWYDRNAHDDDGDECISDSWAWRERIVSISEEQKGMNYSCGRLAKTWMSQAGFVDVKQYEYIWPFCGESEETGEMRAFGRYSTEALPGMLWHVIERLIGDGSEGSKREVEEMRRDMKRCLKGGKRMYQKFYVTVGRRPE